MDEDAWSLLKVDTSTDGERVTEITSIHPLLEVKEKINRIRQQVLESLTATPKEKYKKAAALKRRDDETVGDHCVKLKKAIGAIETKKGTSVDEIKADAEKLADDDTINADWEAEKY